MRRRNWLKWVGLGSVGVIMVLLLRPWELEDDAELVAGEVMDDLLRKDTIDEDDREGDAAVNDDEAIQTAEPPSSVEAEPESESQPASSWDQITLNEPAVTVDRQGTIVRSDPVMVDTYVEDLGNAMLFRMVRVPGGVFWMGQTEAETQELIRQKGGGDYRRFDFDELPRHQVTVPTFFMGMVTVTQAVYGAVMGQNPAAEFDRDRFVAPDKPVIGVSWNDAIAFCEKLSNLTGKTYRLPTEAEWEYACRAETTTPFHFGETITTAIANYNGNLTYGEGSVGEDRRETTPVGSFPPNSFGLFDMHGNVLEWCADDWHENYNNAPTDGSAWVDQPRGDFRIFRGGSWYVNPIGCRSAYRHFHYPNTRSYAYGFRVVVSNPRLDRS